MDRRKEERPDSPDRRDFPRPPLVLNLLILALGLMLAGTAYLHDKSLERRFRDIFVRGASAPAEIRTIRQQLSKMELEGDVLKRELNSRLSAVKSRRSNNFYLSIDTSRKQFGLYLGSDLVREAQASVGPPATFRTPIGTWSFPPLKGSSRVKAKYHDFSWRVQPWVYAMNGQPIPEERPRIPNALGRYVIELENDYLIHTPPSPESPLKGPKPGSFMVPEEIMRAIWPRVEQGMPVYVF